VKKQNQEVKEPIQKEKQKVMVKYTCPQCKTALEVERSTVERKVQCKKCKKELNLLPAPPKKPKKKLSLKQKQKWCLWVGTGIMDLVGAAILHDRVVGRYGLQWSALDAFFLMTLIIITTAVFFYTLSLADGKPKDEQTNK